MINHQIRNNPLLTLSLNYSLANIHTSIALVFQLQIDNYQILQFPVDQHREA